MLLRTVSRTQNGVKSVHLDEGNCDCYSTLRCVGNLCSCKTFSMQAGSIHLVVTYYSIWCASAESIYRVEHQDTSRTEGFRQRPKLLHCFNITKQAKKNLDVLLT